MPNPDSTPVPAFSKPVPSFHLGHPEGDHIPFFELPRHPSKIVPRGRLVLLAILAAGVACLGQWLEHLGKEAPAPDIALAWVLPFALLLMGIAVMPLLARHFWERHYHHLAVALAVVVSAWYVFFQTAPAGHAAGFLASHAGAVMAASCGDYISFIFLLGSLFILSGGIVVRVRRRGTPLVNVGLLLAGALLANLVGTTGAAMLLVRPFLRINHGRVRPFHMAFFIFLVANVGGALTPIGDPPLLLGYLRGIPFWWVAARAWPMWLVAVGCLLGIFFLLDVRAARGQTLAPPGPQEPGPVVSVFGLSNLLLIFLVVAGILLHEHLVALVPLPWRELIMIGAVVLSFWSTPHQLHAENVFNFAPIREVAYLFLGIFITMVPALNYVARHAGDPAFQAGLHTPGQFYFASGTLSSILDNAPTYLLFLQAAVAKSGAGSSIGSVLADAHGQWCVLAAAMASVFFGAMTYIGNGPNFMVKSMAEHAGVKCPSFFQYILFYALPLLLPVLILVWALFFRRPPG